MTVESIIKSSLRALGVLGLGETPPAEVLTNALETLNTMLAAWAVNGLTTTEFATVGEEFTLSGFAPAVKWALAAELSADFGRDPSPMIMALANRTFSDLKAVNLVIEPQTLQTLSVASATYDIEAG